VSGRPPSQATQATTVGGFTEQELIGRIQQRLPAPPDWLLVGIGDDAAVVEPERNRVEVLSVDCLVEGVHFDRAFGWRLSRWRCRQPSPSPTSTAWPAGSARSPLGIGPTSLAATSRERPGR